MAVTPDQIIIDQRKYTDDLVEQGKEFMEDAADRIAGIGFIVPNFIPAVLPDVPTSDIDLTPPARQVIDFDLPPEPTGTLTFQDIPAMDAGVAPVLTASAPALFMPTKPSQLADFNEAAPDVNTSYVVPSPPDELMNPFALAPVLPDRAAPLKPTIALPGFDATRPDDMPAAPTDLEGRMQTEYRGAMPMMASQIDGYVDAWLTKNDPDYFARYAKVEERLNALLAGGTGFNPAVENAMYERNHSKNLAEARRIGKEAMRAAADRGFTIPPGAATAAARAARQAAGDNNARAATEIVILQAETEQRNLQFVVTTTVGLRTAMQGMALNYMQNMIAINGQSLDLAKSVTLMVLEGYNTAVKAFTVKLEAYKAEAAVYDTRLRAAMAEMELYKAEIQALEALTNVDRAKVDIYRARIDVLQVQANVYKSRIDAVLGQASLEKLKIDLFGAKIQAHAARVQAKNSEWQGYIASIEGETSKVKVYGQQVDAFKAQMAGYETVITAKAKVIDAAAATNKARIDQYLANVSVFKTISEARGAQAQVKLDGQRIDLLAFQSATQAAVNAAQIKATYFKEAAAVSVSNAALRFNVMIKEGDYRMNFGNVMAQLANHHSNGFARVASAAASSMNTLAANVANQ